MDLRKLKIRPDAIGISRYVFANADERRQALLQKLTNLNKAVSPSDKRRPGGPWGNVSETDVSALILFFDSSLDELSKIATSSDLKGMCIVLDEYIGNHPDRIRRWEYNPFTNVYRDKGIPLRKP